MRLRVMRENVGLTQEALGKLVGVEQHTVSQWESGCRMPRADKLPRLANVLGCTINDLFEDNEKAASNG